MWQIKFYQVLAALAHRGGRAPVALIAGLIGAAFFCLFPQRLKTSVRFYRVLFPNRSGAFHIWSAWRQYQNFVTIFVDRLFAGTPGGVTWRSTGWTRLTQALAAGRGAIVIMSHIGNWEIAAHLLHQRTGGLPLLLLLGRKHQEQIEALQKTDLPGRGVTVMAVGPDQNAALDILTILNWLRAGGVVALTGDVVWHKLQRVVAVDFLGRGADLPELPHRLALASGAPLLVFFGCRNARRIYHLSFSAPRYVHAETARQRRSAVQASAQAYAARLEEQLRRYPWQWYHFSPFLKGQDWTRSHRPKRL